MILLPLKSDDKLVDFFLHRFSMGLFWCAIFSGWLVFFCQNETQTASLRDSTIRYPAKIHRFIVTKRQLRCCQKSLPSRHKKWQRRNLRQQKSLRLWWVQLVSHGGASFWELCFCLKEKRVVSLKRGCVIFYLYNYILVYYVCIHIMYTIVYWWIRMECILLFSQTITCLFSQEALNVLMLF